MLDELKVMADAGNGIAERAIQGWHNKRQRTTNLFELGRKVIGDDVIDAFASLRQSENQATVKRLAIAVISVIKHYFPEH